MRLADAALSTAQEYGVSVAANGTLYFASNRDGGTRSFDIYRANFKDGDCETPVNLGDVINTKGPEVQPAISPDENTLVFTAFGRDDEITGVHKDYNKGDLYISYRQDGVWTHPRNCGPAINSGGQESSPGFSIDGKRFFFSSERASRPIARRAASVGASYATACCRSSTAWAIFTKWMPELCGVDFTVPGTMAYRAMPGNSSSARRQPF